MLMEANRALEQQLQEVRGGGEYRKGEWEYRRGGEAIKDAEQGKIQMLMEAKRALEQQLEVRV